MTPSSGRSRRAASASSQACSRATSGPMIDLLDAEVVVEDAGDHRGRVEGLGVRAEDEAEALQCVR